MLHQVSKGRDTGVSQVTGFTAKISMGNGMQVRNGLLRSIAAVVNCLSFRFRVVLQSCHMPMESRICRIAERLFGRRLNFEDRVAG